MLCGDVELVALLLDKEQQSFNPTQSEDTLLHIAVSENLEPVVKMLIDCGANVNLRNNDGLYPTNVSAKRGNVNILKLLLDVGASVENKSCQAGRTNIFYAIESGNKDVVKQLF